MPLPPRATSGGVSPAVHDALAQWAADEFRSLNAHVEMLLRRALGGAGRMPKRAGPMPKRAGHLPLDPKRIPTPYTPSD
jgi:hypothetical protein